jgi:membrane fusion protein, multidrug efflux system
MEAEFQRYEKLVAMGAVSRSEFDLKRNDFLAQQAQYDAKVNDARQTYQGLEAQRARMALAQKALDDTLIRAPYGGLIAEKHVNLGQFVQRGARVATLVKVDPLRVELTVPETAAASVKRGQRVVFTVQTYPDRSFAGTVAYVGPALRIDSRSLVVEALVPNANGALQPGLFATARIELPALTPALFVPAAAVRTEAGVSRLFVIKDGRAEQRFVQVGRDASGRLEMLRGLQTGERVAVDALDRLTDGAPVAVAGAAGGR